MKKLVLILLASLFAFSPLVKADEGMWLLMYLDKQTYKDMKAKGLMLSFSSAEVVQVRLFPTKVLFLLIITVVIHGYSPIPL